MREHFSAIDAEIWFLTETQQGIVPNRDYFSCFSGDSDRSGEEGELWVAIWAKWPLQRLESHASDLARSAAGRIADTPFGDLILYGTVLPWTNEWRGIPGANGQAFEAALALQMSDWQKLRIDFPDATLIVAGDFNQDLAGWHYYGSKKKRKLLENALLKCDLIPLTSGVNDPIARESPPMACIDHIFISGGNKWILESTSRWPSAPKPEPSLSDHFGVSARLSYASTTARPFVD